MILKNSMNFISEFFNYSSNQIRKIYLNSRIYNKKISKIDDSILTYKPNLNILSSLISYEKKKDKIENFYINSIWDNKNISHKDYKKLHSFYWLFSIDLKSSSEVTQSIIQNWIEKNKNYSPKIWEIDILSKRVISWISNTQITYDGSDNNFKKNYTVYNW